MLVILRNHHAHRANKRVLITIDSNEEKSHLGTHIVDHALFRPRWIIDFTSSRLMPRTAAASHRVSRSSWS